MIITIENLTSRHIEAVRVYATEKRKHKLLIAYRRADDSMNLDKHHRNLGAMRDVAAAYNKLAGGGRLGPAREIAAVFVADNKVASYLASRPPHSEHRRSQIAGIARRERVAGVEPSGLEPGAEPAHALRRGAVGERLGVDPSVGLCPLIPSKRLLPLNPSRCL